MDDNGNIIQIGGTDYGYDALNRLDEEDSGSAVTYTYDATSNRLTKGGTSTTVPSTSNKISAVGGTSITYSSSGAFLTNGTQSYVWNAAEQMAESKVSGSTVGTYTYDSQNRRTKKVAGGNTTQYVYGLNGLLYGEYTTAGALIREYVYLDDAPLAQIDAGTPEVLTYLHTDHLGTPRFGTNTGGTQVWTWTSDAFGVGAPSGARTVNLRMPGQYFDAESDLFYNWNRYYNPTIGRYVSSDPIGIDGGLNTFLYAEASPTMFADPEGLVVLPLLLPAIPVVVEGGVAAAGAAASACARNPRCAGLVIKGGAKVVKNISEAVSAARLGAMVAQPNFCPMAGATLNNQAANDNSSSQKTGNVIPLSIPRRDPSRKSSEECFAELIKCDSAERAKPNGNPGRCADEFDQCMSQ